MSSREFLRERIRKTGAALLELEAAVARDPSPSLMLMTMSVRQELDVYKQELGEDIESPAGAVQGAHGSSTS